MAKRIAIVEDDPDQRSNYVDAITKKGYDVTAYSSRQEALRGFERELPDLAILDIILGDEVDAGFEICRDLLAKSASLPGATVPIRSSRCSSLAGLSVTIFQASSSLMPPYFTPLAASWFNRLPISASSELMATVSPISAIKAALYGMASLTSNL